MKLIAFTLAAFLMIFTTAVHAEKVWTSFTNHDTIHGIAIQGPYLWCATSNGPVR